jgi:hypothetical protein
LRLNLTFAASYETSEEAIKLIAGRWWWQISNAVQSGKSSVVIFY